LLSMWIYRILRIALAGVFIWSGISKLFDPSSFALIIDAYGLVPRAWVMPVSVALPAGELAAGIGLLMDVRGSLATVAGLLMLFAAILGYGIRMGLDVDCGCFGPGDPEGEAYHGLRPALYRDAVMITGAAYLYYSRHARACKPARMIDWVAKIKRRNG
jgi:uncharacterized membrane protein YphA (DoxX/SURF4 family)